jgi:uncharacterized membrane protein YfcA
MILKVLLAILALAAVVYIWILLTACIRDHAAPRGEAVALGAITNFFDTLGIGSFAPTMSWMKFRKLVPDHDIPPTMLAGHSLPTFVQSGVFLVLLGVQVDPILLLGCIIAMVAGGYVGVPIARRAPTKVVQLVVAFALLAAAVFYILANLDLMPIGGTAASLPLPYTVVAIAVHFVLGILLNFGVGAYAPTLAVLSLLGMDPRLAFPIMTSAGAFSMGVSGIRLVRARDVDLRIVLGMVLGGIPAVLVAAFLVREMPVTMLRWLVVVVVLYAATLLLWAALTRKSKPAE